MKKLIEANCEKSSGKTATNNKQQKKISLTASAKKTKKIE